MKILLTMFIAICLIGIASAGTIVNTLNFPPNNYVNSNSSVIFNVTSNTTVSYLKNISLCTNNTGSWVCGNTMDSYYISNATSGTNITTNSSFSPPQSKTFDNDLTTFSGLNGLGEYIQLNFTSTYIRLIRVKNNIQSATVNVSIFCGSSWTVLKEYSSGAGANTENLTVNQVCNAIKITQTSAGTGSDWYEATPLSNLSSPSTITFPFTLTTTPIMWNVLACDTDNSCNYATTNYTLLYENNRTYNSTTYETSRESFTLNATGMTSATLYWNGTSYSTSVSNNVATTSLDIPLISSQQNVSFYWIVNGIYTTANSTQTINPIILTLCNATYPTQFINFTFKDEGNLSSISATIPSSTWNYYLGSGSVYKTLTYLNTTANPSYAFCFNVNRTLYTDLSLQYANTNYPQRIYNPSTINLNNTVTNQVLYLLYTSEGYYVTFQITNAGDQVLSGVSVQAVRQISGSDYTIGSGITGADGTVTFFLNPNFEHDFMFSKTGFNTYTTSFFPSQTSYTIKLSGGTTSQNSSFQGIDYSIIPVLSYLVNDTEYTFGFNLTSSYWDVSEYGFNLRLANGTIITGSSTGTEGTQLTKLYNVNNQTIIYLDAYWVINGNYTNITRMWTIQNTANTGWSIATFFTDLNLYLDSGIFGLDEFGRYLIAFLVLFMITGFVSYKYGLSSPLAVTTIIFSVVFFLDVIVGVIPEIRGINHLLTYIVALALVLSILMEVRR